MGATEVLQRRNSSVRYNSIVIKMPKNILVFDLQRPSTAVPWGITVCGGRDQGLTFKIGNVKRMSPASKAGLSKMDYLISINGRPVFNMTHCEMAREIKSSGATLRLECERGDHIVPSFDELFPGLRQDDDPDSTKGSAQATWCSTTRKLWSTTGSATCLSRITSPQLATTWTSRSTNTTAPLTHTARRQFRR